MEFMLILQCALNRPLVCPFCVVTFYVSDEAHAVPRCAITDTQLRGSSLKVCNKRNKHKLKGIKICFHLRRKETLCFSWVSYYIWSGNVSDLFISFPFCVFFSKFFVSTYFGGGVVTTLVQSGFVGGLSLNQVGKIIPRLVFISFR